MSSSPEKTVMVFITNGTKVLLHRRLNTWFGNDEFAPPGGMVDNDETPETAAKREVFEETNLIIKTTSLELLEKNVSKGQGRYFENFYFHTTEWSGEIENVEPNRHSELNWYEISSLPNSTMKIVKELIVKLPL